MNAKEEEEEEEHPDSIVVNMDPFATTTQKSFSLNPMEFADTIKDVSNFDIVSVDFSRRIKDIWFNHFYKPISEMEMEQIIEQNRKEKDNMKSFEEEGPSTKYMQVYRTLGDKIQFNIHKKLPNIHEEADNYLIERDIMRLWRKRVLQAYDIDIEEKQFFKNNLQEGIFSILNDYRDFYFPCMNNSNSRLVIESIVLHTVNHIVKKKRYEIYNAMKREIIGSEDYEVRDGALNPTAILFLVPFRSTALKLVNLIFQLLPKVLRQNVAKLDVFEFLFSEESTNEEAEEIDEEMDNENEEKSVKPKGEKAKIKKPEWWKNIFEGNFDDMFVLPLKIDLNEGKAELMGRTSESDIIIATPVALIAENKHNKFETILSSVEIVSVINADTILMQNWEHMIAAFELLNIPLSKSQRTSFPVDWPTLRTQYLYEKASFFRQTIITSRYLNPDINGLLNYCSNIRGIVKVRNLYPYGVISKLKGSVLQIFERFECQKLKKDSDKRYEYFVEHIFPRFKKSSSGRFLIIVSTYLDFVRVRNYFNSERIQFYGLSEYTENSRNLLSKFRKENTRYLLYTERHFYYNAPKLKDFKVNQIFFYSLPENDFIYQAFAERAATIVQTYEACRILSIYSIFDALKLERLIGTDKCRDMLLDKQNVHLIQK
jgi:U3 small nucleolar RNA-associated protein 25